MKSVIRALGFLACSAIFATGLENTRYFAEDNRAGIIDTGFAGWGDISREPVSISNAPSDAIFVTKLADGVFYLIEGGRHSVVVEQHDYAVLIEAALYDKKNLLALNRKIHELVPGKTVKYLINSHVCPEQITDLKSYTVVRFAMSSEVDKTQDIRHESSASYPDDMLTIQSSIYSDAFILDDDSRKIEFYKITKSNDIPSLALIYLPGQKILIETFAFTSVTAGNASLFCQVDLNGYQITALDSPSAMTPTDLLSAIRQDVQ